MSFQLLALALATQTVTSGATVELSSRDITAGDIAEVEGRASTVVARVPQGRESIEIDPQTARRLVANRLPGVQFRLRRNEPVTFVVAAQDRGMPRTCFRAANDLPAGSVLRRSSVETTGCDEAELAAGLSFDRRLGVPIAHRFVARGEYLGSVAPAPDDLVRGGDTLTLRIDDGPVRIEREVRALQAGGHAERIFARTADGDVIAARIGSELHRQENAK